MSSMCFITEITTPVSFPFIHNDIVYNIITKSQTPDHGKAPSRDNKNKKLYRQWDQKLGTKKSSLRLICMLD